MGTLANPDKHYGNELLISLLGQVPNEEREVPDFIDLRHCAIRQSEGLKTPCMVQARGWASHGIKRQPGGR